MIQDMYNEAYEAAVCVESQQQQDQKQRKQRRLAALEAFVLSRPGLEPGNYGDAQSYRAEVRSIGKDLDNARTLLRQVGLRSITADDLRAAARSAYSGRLSLTEEPSGDVRISYCTGQYYPTEYRRAVCAVLASALWAHVRDQCMPAPERRADGHDYYKGKRAGDWLRDYFKREFGRSIASRWFD